MADLTRTELDVIKEELTRRFDHHPPKDEATAELHNHWRIIVKSTARFAYEQLPRGREQSLALTALEEAMMWGNAAIARE